ncbi:MAG: tetratricopeptide repeat protein [Mariprofundaceae bacterium]
MSNDKKQDKNQPIDVNQKDMDELKRDMRSAHLNAWAKENQQKLIAAAVAVLVVLISISFWKEHRDTQRASAATLYHQALNAAQDADKLSLLQSVVNDYDSTAYAALAHLLLAKVDSTHAAEHLLALLNRSDIDAGIRAQARMDLARLHLAAGDKAATRSLLGDHGAADYEQLRHYLLSQAAADDAERIEHLRKARDAGSHDTELAQRIEQQLLMLGAGSNIVPASMSETAGQG